MQSSVPQDIKKIVIQIPAYRLDRICVGVLVSGLPSVPGLRLQDRVRGEGSLPVTGNYRMVDE